MVKRRVYCWMLAFLLTAAVLPVAASAAVNDLKIEQVQVEMPEVQAYFHLNGAKEPSSDEIRASLGVNTLRLTELRRYDPKLDPTSYFFLVDCSTSTTYSQMKAVKTALREFVKDGMGEGGNVTLIAFGVDVQVLLQRETDADIIYEAVDGLAANQPGTLFFDALAKAVDLASNKAYALERKLAFVFSDSVDYNLGGYTKEEVDGMLAATGLPFYAIGFDSGTKQELDNFGAVARASGGDIAVASANLLPSVVSDMVKMTKTAWMARFDAGTNVADMAVQEFTLTMEKSGNTAIMNVPVRHWRPDNISPAPEIIEQQSGVSIFIQFSKPVDGASLPESYAVKNENGDLLGISAAAYDEEARAVLLTFAAAPATGKYTLEFPGITDRTMEKNRVIEPASFSFEGTAPEPEPVAAEFDPLTGAGLVVAGLVLASVIVALAVRSSRKKHGLQAEALSAPQKSAATGHGHVEVALPTPSDGGVQVHFAQSALPAPKIRLRVSGPDGKGRMVEVPVNKSLFVGRSDICDVYFDDKAMSRQHFVISEEKGIFTITDLNSSGGTLLNGVPLKKPRPLHDGDSIKAGAQNIVFFSVKPGGEAR